MGGQLGTTSGAVSHLIYRQFWLAIGNPTDTSTAAYQRDSLADRDGTPTWRRFRLSSLGHPNIAAPHPQRRHGVPGEPVGRRVERAGRRGGPGGDRCRVAAGVRQVVQTKSPIPGSRPGPVA
jgi:hypothetical protein